MATMFDPKVMDSHWHMRKFVDLGREFMPFRDEPDWEVSYQTFLSDSFLGAMSWANLLKHRRIVILAEAGAGKTAELRAKAAALTAAGTPSFYLTVNEVATRGMAQGLALDDEARFKTWLASTAEGVVFLDSVDEARINGKTFAEALKSVARDLGNAQSRTTIIVSCRVSDWRSLIDRSEFASLLGGAPAPAPAPAGSPPNDDALFAPFFGEGKKRTAEEEADARARTDFTPFVVALAPLTLGQAKRLAEWDGVANPDEFIEAVQAADAEDLANRPQDLLALTAYWKDKKAIGTKRQILDWSIQQRLRESNVDLGDRDPVSEDIALSSAKALAAALTLGQKRFLAWPLDTPAAGAADALSLNPKEALPSLNGQQIRALLNRAVFDPATHGRVRFHHRSVQEMLCAQWLIDQLNAGCPTRRVWQMLAEEKYGEIRLRPSLRPVTAWLAQLDDRIRRLVLPIAPELLIEGGDPGILPLAVKGELLERFASRYASRDDAGIRIAIDQLARLAEPGLGGKIQQLWSAASSGEVRELLLRLIWTGKIASCSSIALGAAVSARRHYERALGARALAEIGTPTDRQALAAHLVAHSKTYPKAAIAPALEAVFPSILSLDQLEAVIRAHPQDSMKDTHAGLVYGLQEIVQKAALPDSAGLVGMLDRLIREKPWVANPDRQHSARFWGLAAPLLDLSARLVGEAGQDGLGEAVSAAAGRACEIGQNLQDFRIDEARKTFAVSLEGNAGANREQFWYSVASTRSCHGSLHGHWQADIYHDLWTVADRDWTWLLGDLAHRPLPNDRLIALTALYELWAKGGRDAARLQAIRDAIADAPDLQSALQDMISPPARTPTPQDLEWQRSREERAARRQDEEREAKASWVELRERLAKDPSTISFGELLGIARWINRKDGRDRYSHGDWRVMIDAFSEPVARSARDAFVAFWRTHDPDLDLARYHRMSHGAKVGFIGIAIEAADDPDWAKKLSPQEALIASNYGILEMNGFPDWAYRLWSVRPEVAHPVLKREIRWEFDNATPESHVHHVVSTLAYGKEPLRSAAAVWVLDELETKEPKSDHELYLALDLIIRAEGIPAGRIAALAARRLAATRPLSRRLKWLSICLAVDAVPALAALESLIAKQKGSKKKDRIVEELLTTMFDNGSYQYGPVHQNFRNLACLRRFLTLAYRHVRPSEDPVHEGTFSSDDRDNAASGRNVVLSMLLDLPGEPTYRALFEMSSEPEFSASGERFLVLAERRAIDDSNLAPWTPGQVLAFAKAHEKPPATLADLDQIVCDRLWDIEDDMIAGRFTDKVLLRQDGKSRAEERPVQLEIAKQLELRSRGAYSVEREPELSDYNEPDISVQRAGISLPIAVEIKVADSWSYVELREAIENQLVGKYMRARGATHGHLVLTYHGKKTSWRHPDSGARLDFPHLVRALQAEGDATAGTAAGVDKITVTGIDLTAHTASSA